MAEAGSMQCLRLIEHEPPCRGGPELGGGRCGAAAAHGAERGWLHHRVWHPQRHAHRRRPGRGAPGALLHLLVTSALQSTWFQETAHLDELTTLASLPRRVRCPAGRSARAAEPHPARAQVLKPGGQFLCLEFSQLVLPGLRELYDAYSFNVIPQIGRHAPHCPADQLS